MMLQITPVAPSVMAMLPVAMPLGSALTSGLTKAPGNNDSIGGSAPNGASGNRGGEDGPRQKKGFPPKFLAELQQSRLITNEIGFFESLHELNDDSWSQLGLERASIVNALHKFSFRTSMGESVKINLYFFQTNLIGQPNVALYGRFVTEVEDLIAVWATTVFVDEAGKRGSEIVVVEKDMHRPDLYGFGRAFIAFYNKFNRSLELDYEFVRAAWLGRKVWTRLGMLEYDTRYTFLAGGMAMSQLDLGVENLRRFLSFHGIQEEGVDYVDERGGFIPLREAVVAGEIRRPADFLRIACRQGTKLIVPALIDYNVLDAPKLRDIGEAFVLADCRPYAGQKMDVRFVKNGVPLSDGNAWPPNNRFSDRAMPPWVGIRAFRRG